ncbi:ribosome maturation factor RimP [Ekhidna sp.]
MEILEEQKIRELVEKAIQDQKDLFLVDVKVKGNTGNQKVLVFVDGDNGISIDQCSKISRQVGSELEEEDFMSGKYTLEVSSPGLDYPLSLLRQYKKNIGRMLEVEIDDGSKFEGELVEADDKAITLRNKSEDLSLSFEKIKQSKVKVLFK